MEFGENNGKFTRIEDREIIYRLRHLCNYGGHHGKSLIFERNGFSFLFWICTTGSSMDGRMTSSNLLGLGDKGVLTLLREELAGWLVD